MFSYDLICCFQFTLGWVDVAFLTLDLGSTELKVSVHSEDGQCLLLVSTEIEGGKFRDGRAELPPEALWQAVCKGIRRIENRFELRAAAISSQAESFVPVGKNGDAVGNIILNIDSRAEAEMEELVRAFGKENLYRRTGLSPHPMYTLPKIAWLQKNAPETTDQGMRYLCLEDYILNRLHLEPTIGSSLASRTLALDIHTSEWDEGLLQFAGISSHQLSRVASAGSIVGAVPPSVAADLGLPPNLLWCTGGHDQACASIGSGAIADGDAADGTGTFECISIALDKPLLTDLGLRANLPCQRHAVSGQFLILAFGPGGVALKWLRDNFNSDVVKQAASAERSAYELMLSGIPEGPTGLFFFPYFLGAGTPWLDRLARASIVGLTSRTTSGELNKAALEGVSYEMRWNLEILAKLGLHVERILATGGGARSDEWLQLKADVFGRPVVKIPGEATSRGAAICAAMGLGDFSNWEEASATMAKPGRVFEPRPRLGEQYSELFEKYKDLAGKLYGFQFSGGKDHSKTGVN